jgi:kinesin family protein 2/24
MAFCRLKEDEFVGRALMTPDVQPEKAKLLYFKLWALHIDSRSLPITPAEEAAPAKTAVKKVAKQKVVNPGMFFRLDEYFREDEVKIVMVMAPEPKKSANEEPGYICAAVRPASKESEAFELIVADQRIIKVPKLGEEVFLKYDTKSRYYYLS